MGDDSGFAGQYQRKHPIGKEDKKLRRPEDERCLVFSMKKWGKADNVNQRLLTDKERYTKQNGHWVSVPTYKFPLRLQRVVSQILVQNPDVITLQELDRFGAFMQILRPLGYEGIIQYKPDRVRTGKKNTGKWKVGNKSCAAMGGNGGIPDGVAIIYKKDRLTPRGRKLGGQFKNKNGTLWKQVYLFQRFYDKVNRREYVHGTAHQKSGKKQTDQKAKELQMDQIREILKRFKGVPVIYSADVNTAEGTPCFKRFPSDLLPRSSYPKDSERVSAIKFRKSGPQLEKQGVLDKQMIDCIKH